MGAAVVAYLSGHGFGHFTRSAAVLERLAASGCAVHVRTGALALPLARAAPWAASVAEAEHGPFISQQGPLATDAPATLAALERHVAALPALIAREAVVLRALSAALVWADHPPFALAAAAAAGVPSVAMGNFSWSWILEGLADEDPRFAPLAARLAQAEAQATLQLCLPSAAGFGHVPRREDLPLVVRPPARTRAQARALVVPEGERRPVVLVSFGGFGDALDLGAAARANPRFAFVTFGAARERTGNLTVLPHLHGLPHQDLVLACDVHLSKPGYGTYSEAVAARRPLVLAPRTGFREYPVLVRAMKAAVPCVELPEAALFSGQWSPALEQALAMPFPSPAPALDGAARAAARVLALIG